MAAKSSNRNIKQKTRTVGAALAIPLVLGGAGAGAFITNANAVDNTSTTATTANQARTEKAVTATLANFKGKAPDQTVDNYVHWIFNDSDLPQLSASSRTTYTVNVAELAGVGVKPETLLIGAGATNYSADNLDLPLYADDSNSEARQGSLTLGGVSDATTIRANADGTITIPRNDDSTQRLTFLYSVEKADGSGTVTQRITFNPTLPTIQKGAVAATTAIGQLSTTSENPSEVKVNESGDVTFTYTNNSQITATTAPGSSLDGKIRLSMTRDGKTIELEPVEIKPGETKTISVQNVKASDTAGEITGADFKVIEKLPSCSEPISVGPSDHLAATPITLPNPNRGGSTDNFAKLFFDKDVKRAAPILPAGANVETYPAKTSAGAYFSDGSNGGLAAVNAQNWGASTETSRCYWSSETTNNYDYSVYVKPVAVAEPTPEPTPTTPEVTPEPSTPPAPKPSEPVVTPTPEPSAPVTPAPVPSEPAVTPSTEPTPSETPAPAPSESTPPAPTQEVTTPAPSVTPSEPAVEKPSEPTVVKPSEPGKKVEAKTGHEQEAAKDPTGLIAGISAIVVAALVFFFGRKHFAKWSADAKAKKAAKEAAKGGTETTTESSESTEPEPTAEGEK